MPNYEYTPFGNKILRRKEGSEDDWVEVPADDIDEAKAVIEGQNNQKAENLRAFRQPHSNIRIIRADGTVEEQ